MSCSSSESHCDESMHSQHLWYTLLHLVHRSWSCWHVPGVSWYGYLSEGWASGCLALNLSTSPLWWANLAGVGSATKGGNLARSEVRTGYLSLMVAGYRWGDGAARLGQLPG